MAEVPTPTPVSVISVDTLECSRNSAASGVVVSQQISSVVEVPPRQNQEPGRFNFAASAEVTVSKPLAPSAPTPAVPGEHVQFGSRSIKKSLLGRADPSTSDIKSYTTNLVKVKVVFTEQELACSSLKGEKSNTIMVQESTKKKLDEAVVHSITKHIADLYEGKNSFPRKKNIATIRGTIRHNLPVSLNSI